ncbi:unnamed protein product [Urochloa decumbens]
MDGPAVSIRLRRSTPSHDAYTIYVYDRRFAALATARPSDARRWVATTRWLHGGLHLRGCLVVGLGVQWTPTRLPLHGVPPVPATLQLCVGHRCLLFHLAHADAVPEMLRRFLADPRVTFVGSGSANDRRMLWAHYGIRVARGIELRAHAGMGNASLEDMADRFLGYPGIYKPREVAMSPWHAPRLSPGQVQYACVDAYLAFRLGLLLCPVAAAVQPPRQPVPLPPRAPPPPGAQHQQRPHAFLGPAPPPRRAHPYVRPAPAAQQGPAFVRPAPPARRAFAAVRPAAPAQRAPSTARQAPPVQQRAPAHVHPAPPPPVQRRAPAVFEWSPRAFAGGSVPAVVGVDAGNTVSKVMGDGLIDESDMDSETDYDDDVGVAATNGLPFRVYASDSDDIVDSLDGFEHVKFGAFTDDEDDDCMTYGGTGSLGTADGIGSNGDDQVDEEGCNGDDQEEDEEGCDGDDLEDEEVYDGDDLEDEEGCHEYTGTGILTDDNNMDGYAEFLSNGVAIGNIEEYGHQALQYLGHSEVMLDNVEDALAQDDWYDQGVDYGCDQDDEDEFEEFCML